MSESAGVSRVSCGAGNSHGRVGRRRAQRVREPVAARQPCREDRDAHSGQRLVDIADVPAEPAHPRRRARGRRGAHRLGRRGPCGVLQSAMARAPIARKRALHARNCRCAPGSKASALDARRDFAWASVAALSAVPRARLAWLTRLVQDGLGLPGARFRRGRGAILEVMPLVGRVLETNYGLTFDVRSVAQPENLAYSDLGLGLHTDNPYREPVPGFQALHALADLERGRREPVRRRLRARRSSCAATRRRTSRTLTGTAGAVPLPLQGCGALCRAAAHPAVRHAATVTAVHYNNRSIAPLQHRRPRTRRASMPPIDASRHCCASHATSCARAWAAGTLVVFDNQRILHGRTAFSSARYPRHLRGCYLSRDSVYSETALLRRRLARGPA